MTKGSHLALGLLFTATIVVPASAQQPATSSSRSDSSAATQATTAGMAEPGFTIDVAPIEAPLIAPVRRRITVQPAPLADTRTATAPDDAHIIEQADTARSTTPDSIRVERDGWRIGVRIPSIEPVALSEPIHVNGRIRLYVSLPATPPALAAGVNTGPTGRLMNLAAVQDEDGTRLVVDVSRLAGYRMESDVNGSTLWVDTEPAPDLAASPIISESLSARLQKLIHLFPRAAVSGGVAGLLIASLLAWRFATQPTRRSGQRTDTGSATARTRKSNRASIGMADDAGNHAPTSSPDHSADAAIWAARTLAGSGFDASAIARRTGLPRDAATLLVNGARRTLPVSAGSSVWAAGPTVFATVPIEAII